jgi:O-antigen/teichoic acid export membrane protein
MIRALGKDVAIYGVGEFVFKFIAFSVFPIYAHVFSVAEFGLWALLSVSATLLGFLVNLGVNQAVQRFYFDSATASVDQPAIVATGLLQLLLSGLIIVPSIIGATFILDVPLEQRFGIDRLLLILALAAVIPDQIVQFCLDVLRLHFTPLRFLALAFAKNVVGTALAVGFVLGLDSGLHGLFTGLLLGSLTAVPIGLWLIRRDLAWRFRPGLARSLFLFGFPLTFTSIAYWVSSSMDRWMLAELSSTEQVGLYSVAAKYATIVAFLISAFAQAWIPFAIRLCRDDPDHPAFYARIFSLWYFLLALTGLAMALYAREALMLLTPPEYWPAATILPTVTAGLVLFGTTQVTALGITLEKKTIYSAVGMWATAAANFGLNMALIPHFGALGAAASAFVSYGLLTSFLLYWGQKLHPMPLEKGQLLYCSLLTLLAAFAFLIDFGPPGVGGIALRSLVLLMAVAGAFAVGILDRSVLHFLRPKRAI